MTLQTERPVQLSEPSDAEALFREAKRRERRRRLLIGTAILLVAATAAGIGLGVSGSSGGDHARIVHAATNPPTPVVSLKTGVTMLNLTKSDKYSDITTVGGRILLYGVTTGDLPEASQTCSSAIVNPSTLKLSDLRSGSCADPSLQGESVVPILSAAKTIPGGGVISYAIRVAHVTTSAPGYRLGPVVMTFPEGSTSNPDWIYGDGSLWLYDASSSGGHDLIRISESTGDVVQQLNIPSIVRPLLATTRSINAAASVETAFASPRIGPARSSSAGCRCRR